MKLASSNPLTSIIIVSWNRLGFLIKALDAIKKITYSPLEVIVVDNGSQDGTPEFIKDHYPEVRLICLPKNIGISAYNVGCASAHGEYLIISDDDAFLDKDAISLVVEAFAKEPELGAIAFNVIDMRTNRPWKRWQLPRSNKPIEYYALIGCGFAIRRSLFAKIGGYPPYFFMYMNEIDTAIKVLKTGQKIKFFPNIIVYHAFAPANRSWRGMYYTLKNSLLLFWKYFPLGLALRLTFHRLLISVVVAIKLKAPGGYFKAILKAVTEYPGYQSYFPVARLKPNELEKLRPFLEANSFIYRVKMVLKEGFDLGKYK